MKHNSYILGCLLLLLLGEVTGQQTSQFSQYFLNKTRYNPAFTGIGKCYEIYLGAKYQWLGFENAPRTQFVSFNTPLKFKRYHKIQHGVGVYLELDRAPIHKQTHYKLSYAAHLKVHRDIYLSAGIHAGVEEYAISSNLNDPVLNGITSNFLYPEIFPGLLLHNKNFYIGVSADHIYPMKIKPLNGNNRLIPHYYFTASKRIETNYRFNILYTTLVKFTTIVPPAIDLNMQFEYSRKFILGLGYRVGEAAIATLRIRLLDFLTLGYAFDFPLNKLRTGYHHSQEGILGIGKCSFSEPLEHVPCPAY